ncbi:MAG: transcription-repair coupling factor [Bacteroidales bacterium]|nr:transcription-repair coupling factor [Bacteroidales bacterium]
MQEIDIVKIGDIFNFSLRKRALQKAIADEKCKAIHLQGLIASASAIALSALKDMGKNVIIVANDAEEAGYLYNDICQVCGDNKNVLFFPSGYKRSIKYGQTDSANAILRTEVLGRLSNQSAGALVVTSPEALAEKVISDKDLKKDTLHCKVGDMLDMTEFADSLFNLGFERCDYVYEPGQYSVRGSIIDVFSYAGTYPYRIDFFDDEIDSIRSFDIETQLSKEKVEEIDIIPNITMSEKFGISILEFIDKDTIFAFANLAWACDRIKSISSESIATQLVLSQEGDIDAMQKVIDSDEFASDILNFKRIDYGVRCFSKNYLSIKYDISPQPIYHKDFDRTAESFTEFIKEGYRIYILSDSRKQIDRLTEIFAERNNYITFTAVNKTIHEGFIDRENKICLFTDHQIFDRFHKFSLKSDHVRSGKLALSLKELKQIELGDYIVHIDYGIGRFGGLVRGNINGYMQEMVKLVYQNNDMIFVSIHALHKLSKYKGKEGVAPRIYRLNGNAWNKLKEKTKSKMKEIARDLILLYAKRATQEGFAFSADSFMQHELEASFMYEDTPDQLKTTNEVKADMERARPMDRLICGDVGFGKTEIAVRAAFKAACDNMQTAVLVPTTVLAYQHYNTFKNRLKDFPVKVEYLSRARSAKDTKRILKELAEGEINILIGTHKIIGKDVKFKSLGLLVIDEEQKFGVAVKDKLKQIKSNVDTLTMSATPIPRTLQFSLMGARDLSAITTPPPNRHPIQTEVHPFNEEIIKEAIEFELSRNGQVFFVNNRISVLSELEALIHKLVPDARVIIGHGQMEPEKLERIILDYANHEYDVLLSTTIIEAGVDMPNTNTIIINEAQNFGLSDLHQLRGRVGRSNKKAFCYLLTPPYSVLKTDARRRLQAIENFSELGSGIHIAMQDLDIRGAGNLLGSEQSGFITDLGYETYQKILKEAVTELKTEEFSDLYEEENKSNDNFVSECVIETDMELLFPASYIENESERILLYQELDNMEREEDIAKFKLKLEDRFGRIPKQGIELIRVVTLRRLAKLLGMEKVTLKQGKMNLYFISDENSNYFESDTFGKIIEYVQREPKRAALRENRGKRILTIGYIDSVAMGIEILERII